MLNLSTPVADVRSPTSSRKCKQTSMRVRITSAPSRRLTSSGQTVSPDDRSGPARKCHRVQRLYLALAERLEVPLITIDQKLAAVPGVACPVEVVGATF